MASDEPNKTGRILGIAALVFGVIALAPAIMLLLAITKIGPQVLLVVVTKPTAIVTDDPKISFVLIFLGSGLLALAAAIGGLMKGGKKMLAYFGIAAALLEGGVLGYAISRVAPEGPAVAVGKVNDVVASAEVKSANAFKLVVEPGGKITFEMPAPDEKIYGEIVGDKPPSGELYVDPKDLTKTTGKITGELGECDQEASDESKCVCPAGTMCLSIFQSKPKNGEFGPKVRNKAQNEHARSWLDLTATPDDSPGRKDDIAKSLPISYTVTEVTEVSEKDLSKLTGAKRKVTLTVKGVFHLHRRNFEETAKLEAEFTFDGDKMMAVHFKTVAPMNVGLEKYDVVPRDKDGKLAQRALGDLQKEGNNKVASEAGVTIEFDAKVSGAVEKPAAMPVGSGPNPEKQTRAEGSASAAPSAPPESPPKPKGY
jgi:hypothetical protein